MRCSFSGVLLVLALGWPSLVEAAETQDPLKLAEVIDARLAEMLAKAGGAPAPLADDATFLRRASLDLIGRIPSASEVRQFLADPTPSDEKRIQQIHRLIDSGGHTRHMATFWRRTWIPQADTPEFSRLADDFEAWVAFRMRGEMPYDRVVRELLTLGEVASERAGKVTPTGFYAASEYKPENLAANATRVFLGVNLDCAQCHNHPFARWTRDQFWQTAAFFGPPRSEGGKILPARLTIPNTKRSLAPELLDGTSVKWPEAITPDTGRRLLTDWLVAKDNPYFARNAVNRLWAHLYGTALVEPLDDLSGEGREMGEHDALLQELADAFAASGFDLKYITRALVLTQAYQRSAADRDSGSADPQRFDRMLVRGLTGEQLYDSLRTAAGLPPERDDTDRGQGLEARKRFAAQFYVERPVTAERSITQALSIMNGQITSDLISLEKNPTLAGVVDAPFLDTKGKVETLFLAVLGRLPREAESRRLLAYLDNEGAGNGRERAFGDLFWALVNTTEFNTNH